MNRPQPLRPAALVAASILFLTACSTTSISTDHDSSFDFSSLHSFAVQTGKFESSDGTGASMLVLDRVNKAVEGTLVAGGFTMADTESADFIVSLHGGTTHQSRVEPGMEVGYGMWRGWGAGEMDIDIHDYTEGVMVFDVVDRKSKKAIWRAVAKDVLGDKAMEQKEISTIVGKVFKGFPPSEPK